MLDGTIVRAVLLNLFVNAVLDYFPCHTQQLFARTFVRIGLTYLCINMHDGTEAKSALR
jgi:hypothetical protein